MKNTMETRHVHRAGSPMRLYRYIPLPFVRIILVLGYYHRILGGLGPVASRDESEVVEAILFRYPEADMAAVRNVRSRRSRPHAHHSRHHYRAAIITSPHKECD